VGDEYRSISSSLWSFLYSAVTSFLLGPNSFTEPHIIKSGCWSCNPSNTDSLWLVKTENYGHCEEKTTAVCQSAFDFTRHGYQTFSRPVFCETKFCKLFPCRRPMNAPFWNKTRRTWR
jgi:hypothetical protein